MQTPRPGPFICFCAALVAVPAIVMLAGSLFVLVGVVLGADVPGGAAIASLVMLLLTVPLLIAEYLALFRRRSSAAFWIGVACALVAIGGIFGGGIFGWLDGFRGLAGLGPRTDEYGSWWELLAVGAIFCSIVCAGVGHLFWCRVLCRPPEV
jgi:hypothetical protein